MTGVTYTATLQGAEQVMRRFARIEKATGKKIVRSAVRAGLKPQLQRARATTRFTNRTGRTRKALGISVRKGREREQILGRVKIRNNNKDGRRQGWNGVPLEYGHRIAVDAQTGRTESGVRLWRLKGKPRSLKKGQYHGVSAGFVQGRWFMVEAFKATVDAAERQFTERFVRDVYLEAANG